MHTFFRGKGSTAAARPSPTSTGSCRGRVATADGLRDRLIGAWTLVSYVETPVGGSNPVEPLGHQPRGIIIYTPDGYMSAQSSTADRRKFASGDWFASTLRNTRRRRRHTSPIRGPSMSTRPPGASPTRCSLPLFPDRPDATASDRVARRHLDVGHRRLPDPGGRQNRQPRAHLAVSRPSVNDRWCCARHPCSLCSTSCYDRIVARTIAQRNLRNDNAKVIDAVVAGETFIVTRNGEPVAELRPIRAVRRTFITRGEVAGLASAAVRIDHRQFRADLDQLIDQGL